MKNLMGSSNKYSYFSIGENVLRAKDTVIQLSSVCCTKVGKNLQYAMSKAYIIACFAFVLCIVLGALIVELFYFVAAGCAIFAVYKLIQDSKNEIYYLVIELNSGSRLLFECYDMFFLEKAQEEMVKCMNDGKGCAINFNECTIKQSQIGERNKMYNGGN